MGDALLITGSAVRIRPGEPIPLFHEKGRLRRPFVFPSQTGYLNIFQDPDAVLGSSNGPLSARSGRLTFDITGWRGFITPVRVDGWVSAHGRPEGQVVSVPQRFQGNQELLLPMG